MRVVTTNDFVGSFFPQETSYGRLPGGAALRDAVRGLGGVWVDTGDFAQGAALNAVTGGAWGLSAAAQLGIDVAVVGNHELDWGLDHLRAHHPPFPLLAANLPGFPATHVADDLAVIGVSLPSMGFMHPGTELVDADLPALARSLRADGARWVVVAVHDGPDPAFCAPLRGVVDLVLGGHTLQCFAGEVAGVPFLQPWAFGSQVGVADLTDAGVALSLHDVGPPLPWSDELAALEADVVGHLDHPLRGHRPIAEAVARELLGVAGAVYIGPGDLWNQPARDGFDAYLPSGDVSMAQVLRLTPFTGGRSVWGGALVATPEVETVLAALPEATVARGTGDTLALTTFHAAWAERLLGGPLELQPLSATLRDGLLAAVAS